MRLSASAMVSSVHRLEETFDLFALLNVQRKFFAEFEYVLWGRIAIQFGCERKNPYPAPP